MPDDTEVAALHAQLEAIVKDAEDAEAQAAAARSRVQATRLLEESKATTLVQTATAARQRVPSSSSPAAASQLVPTASSTYEDTVIAGLHLQAAAVLNIRHLVNIVLDCSSTNYTSWRDLMEQALQRYALIKHVTDDASSNDPGWIQMDSVVLNWISNSISVDLHQVVRERGCTARHLWLAIENQFLGNREQPSCASSCMSFRLRHRAALSSTAITSAPCTSPPTPFSINARSMWRLIFISSERRLSSVKSASSMSRRHRSSPTSS
jgi:hypothetical protein